jgi:hypothetical protein
LNPGKSLDLRFDSILPFLLPPAMAFLPFIEKNEYWAGLSPWSFCSISDHLQSLERD